MNARIQTLADFIKSEQKIAEKTTTFINEVGWEKAETVLAEAMEAFQKAHEDVIEILENEDFEKWFEMGVELNSRNYDFYAILGIEDEAEAIKEAYQNKNLLREVFDRKIADYKEYLKVRDSLSA